MGGGIFATAETDDNGAHHTTALNCQVLLLNAHYVALRVISARRAISLLFKESNGNGRVAEVVHVEDGRYISYDFDDWIEWSLYQRHCTNGEHDWIRAIRFDLAVPRIIRVLTYSRVNGYSVRLNRRNILARDQHRCQYCGKQFPTNQLSLDHVIPRSQNGPSTWENIVCSCLKCNVRKGGRTPVRAGMKLISKPVRPKRSPAICSRVSDHRYRSWLLFLDRGHWNVTA